MRVTLHLYAALREHAGGQRSIEAAIEPGETLGGLLDRLGIPRERTHILFVNNRLATFDQPLAADDRVAAFPAVGGG